jgi:hypothetical protein
MCVIAGPPARQLDAAATETGCPCLDRSEQLPAHSFAPVGGVDRERDDPYESARRLESRDRVSGQVKSHGPDHWNRASADWIHSRRRSTSFSFSRRNVIAGSEATG